MSSETTIRRPYKGSCHCGRIRYIAYIRLPIIPKPDTLTPFRKCNCIACVKLNFFHVRLEHSPSDFRLLDPLDPDKDLGNYLCNSGEINWWFCRQCSVRCFAQEGETVVKEVSVDWEEKGGGEKIKAWCMQEQGWIEGETGYLSVNATTLEHGQEGLDLREWHEKKWITYLDWRHHENPGKPRTDKPYEAGVY